MKPHQPPAIERHPGKQRSGWSRVAVVVLALLCAVTAFVAFQRYTAYGILAAGGGRYWVVKAADESDPQRAKAHLKRVVQATQYGVNIAENAVAELQDHEDRIRLWGFLIELAPNAHWRQLYMEHLATEQMRPLEN